MDHKQQHHEQHRHEREIRKKHAHEHANQPGKMPWPIHPKWLLILAFAAILAAVLVWTFVVW